MPGPISLAVPAAAGPRQRGPWLSAGLRAALTRNVLILAACQAIFQTGLVLVMTVGGLAGHLLAGNKTLATLPIAAMMLGTTITLGPAALLMARIGRRAGFMLGTLLGAGGGTIAALGLLVDAFAVFIFGHVLLGAYQGFAQYYRFAAVDAARREARSRAISLVIAGGLIAAVAGPLLATLTKDLSLSGPFVASYAALVVLGLAATALVALLDKAAPIAAAARAPVRPLVVIVRQTGFLVALGGAAVAWGVMYLAMAPMPLAMTGHGHALSDVALVFQGHVLAMAAPSFVAGALIARFGAPLVMLAGVMLLGVQLAVAVSGLEIAYFLSALILLGIGWNFTYIGGTALLTETYSPAEQAKAQAVNDVAIFSVVVIASLGSGAVFEFSGWQGVNLVALPFTFAAAAAIAFLMLARRGHR